MERLGPEKIESSNTDLGKRRFFLIMVTWDSKRRALPQIGKRILKRNFGLSISASASEEAGKACVGHFRKPASWTPFPFLKEKHSCSSVHAKRKLSLISEFQLPSYSSWLWEPSDLYCSLETDLCLPVDWGWHSVSPFRNLLELMLFITQHLRPTACQT